jgi:hypothetical protein
MVDNGSSLEDRLIIYEVSYASTTIGAGIMELSSPRDFIMVGLLLASSKRLGNNSSSFPKQERLLFLLPGLELRNVDANKSFFFNFFNVSFLLLFGNWAM